MDSFSSQLSVRFARSCPAMSAPCTSSPRLASRGRAFTPSRARHARRQANPARHCRRVTSGQSSLAAVGETTASGILCTSARTANSWRAGARGGNSWPKADDGPIGWNPPHTRGKPGKPRSTGSGGEAPWRTSYALRVTWCRRSRQRTSTPACTHTPDARRPAGRKVLSERSPSRLK